MSATKHGHFWSRRSAERGLILLEMLTLGHVAAAIDGIPHEATQTTPEQSGKGTDASAELSLQMTR